MSAVNSDSVRAGAAGVSAAYTIEQSCRFNDDDASETVRTWDADPDNIDIVCVSVWLKRGNLGMTNANVLNGGSSATDIIRFSTDSPEFTTEGSTHEVQATRLMRDPTAWFHLFVLYNSPDGTGDDRMQLWINGVRETVLTTNTNVTQNRNSKFTANGSPCTVGAYDNGTQNYDGYMAEFIMIDGTAYSASDFGELDSNGNWIPKDPSELTFGTNGVWLDFADSSDFGNDVSGNNNDFTDANLATNDQMNDSPSNSADDDVGNYWVLNPLAILYAASTLSNGNLDITQAAGSYEGHASTIPIPTSGKWAIKVKLTGTLGGANDPSLLLATFANGQCQPAGSTAYNLTNWYTAIGFNSFGSNMDIEYLFEGGSRTLHYNGSGIAQNDDIEFLIDMDAGTFKVYHDTSQFGTTLTSVPTTLPLWICASVYATSMSFYAEFTPQEAGYSLLHTANLPAPAIKDSSKFFQVANFTGTAGESVHTLTDADGGAVKPDLVWIKDRGANYPHVLTDSARGATKVLRSDVTSVESTAAQGLKSFDSSGFTLGTDSDFNGSGRTILSWCWNTQGGAGSSNTAGTINTTTTSVGTTQGLSISTYVGTGSAATIGHGLGVAPEFILVKERTNDAGSWFVYHQKNTTAPETDYLVLEAQTATADDATVWNDTAPTSTVFSIGTHDDVNGSSDTYVAYCWVGIEGYSKFGAYEGNGNASGTFIWLGFRPAWFMTKSPTDSWYIWDKAKHPHNVGTHHLIADTNVGDGTAGDEFDFLSNGVKIRSTNTGFNGSGTTYLFAAFAEFPFGGEGVAQARAR